MVPQGREKNLGREKPQLGGFGRRKGIPRNASEQGKIASRTPWTKPLEGKGFVAFVEGKNATLPLDDPHHTRRQAAMVVKLLTGPKLQGLQGFGQGGLNSRA
jgi:hypothetical protein